MLRDDRGASAAEYALILAIIGAVIALAALGLCKAIGNAMNNTATCINNPTSGMCRMWLGGRASARPPLFSSRWTGRLCNCCVAFDAGDQAVKRQTLIALGVAIVLA
jgi:pilus assembly protein Flp/PilA